MSLRCIFGGILVLAITPVFAAGADLAFQPAGKGLYRFDTGTFKGRLKLDGRYQGVYPLVDVATGDDLVRPPGVFSPYRLFATNHRFGHAARDWPTRSKILPDGAVEAFWPAGEEHPLEMTGVYRWSAADTLDLAITVKPQQDMPRFELFMSSYFIKTFRASVYMRREDDGGEKRRFEPVDRTPSARGGYVMFPRDESGVAMIRDGRWKIPPNPVDWDLQRWMAAPVAFRRDAARDLTALMLCPPDDCFALCSPWNPATPEGGGYRSLYLSLFGRDLKAGESARARCRLVIARGLSDEQALERYAEYLKPQER